MMSDRMISIVRTVVPALWGAGLAWAIQHGLPPEVVPAVDAVDDTILIPLAMVAVYAGARWMEDPRRPAWVRLAARLLLGSGQQPAYASAARSAE
jgi:hypothetical protein